MEIHYTELGTGSRKVLYDVEMLQYYRIEFESINKSNDYHFYFLQRGQFVKLFKHDVLNRISFKRLNSTYKNSKELREYYDSLLNFCKQHGIQKIIFTSTGQYWHPSFLKQLKACGIDVYISTADDDGNTINYCSRPYTKYYDIHFHVGVMYDKQGTTIADKLKEWGGNPVWMPLGARADHVNPDVDFNNRDIDVCYIGNVNPRKLLRLSKLKRHFGDRLKLFGGQGNGDWGSLKGIFYKLVNKFFRLGYIEPISEDKLREVYRRTKIGFNMHLFDYKGPSNSRMYELPANGVMQLCDNELGLWRSFKVGEEVIAYKNMSDAIQKIEYYLQSDEKRIKIAVAGHRKAVANYRMVDSIQAILDLIFKGE